MKREFLQSLKVGEQSLPKEIVDAIMAENGRDIEKTRAAFGDYEQIRTELEQAKAHDWQALENSVREWEEKYRNSQKQQQEQLRRLEFQNCLSGEIRALHGRNQKAIEALLDRKTLENSEDREQAVRKALCELREKEGYLFDQDPLPPAYAQGTGARTPSSGHGPVTLAGALREKFERKN